MEENKKKNPDQERKSKLISAILMAFVCVLMMGGGTYAWFTMSNTAKVTSMKLNVASEGNLKISTQNEANWENISAEVAWPGLENAKTLYPCTTPNGREMHKPKYTSENEVGSETTLIDTTGGYANSEATSYYLEQRFWLYLDDGMKGGDATHADYTVHLAKGAITGTGNTRTASDGTYFISSEETLRPENCVRVSFTVLEGDVTKTYVYEPNSDGDNGGNRGTDYANNGITNIVASDIKQNTDGTWMTGDALSDSSMGESEAMFTITGGTPKEVVVRVWFEGTDNDCRNDIELKDITAQLKFIANKTTAGN